MRTLTKKCQSEITPSMALELLKTGNERFVKNLKVNRNLLQQVNETSDAQHPFAVIISCMDSRTSSELVFDQGLGDIFSIRIAGNVINDDIIGSTEFGCKAIGAKIVVVLGHTGCGAIKGAMNNVELGKLHSVTNKIQRCIPRIKSSGMTDGDMLHGLTVENMHQGISDLLSGSEILSKMAADGEITLVGGIYDVSTGVVSFTNELRK